MSVSRFVREYGGVVWTNHALERLSKRGIPQADALTVMKSPSKTYPGKKGSSVRFIRTVNGRRLFVVAVMDEEAKKWIVLSVWVRGEEDKLAWYERLVRARVDWMAGRIARLFRG